MRDYRKHGLSRTPEYRARQTMRLRCTVPENPAYADYGGRGITVCDRWLNDVAAFVADMGPKPTPRHEIDRKNNDLGYFPENCRWATRKENSANRRSNHWVTLNGERMTLIEAIRKSGISEAVATKRLAAGWSEDRAFNTPTRTKSKKGFSNKPKTAPQENKTGFKGVKKRRSVFCASRMVKGKMLYSRSFPTAELAHAWYVAAEFINDSDT